MSLEFLVIIVFLSFCREGIRSNWGSERVGHNAVKGVVHVQMGEKARSKFVHRHTITMSHTKPTESNCFHSLRRAVGTKESFDLGTNGFMYQIMLIRFDLAQQ